MFEVKIGSAPISWDVLSFGGSKTSGLTFSQMLDGIATAGYEGTEIAVNGFFPADAESLLAALNKRNLKAASSYVALTLEEEGALEQMIEHVDRVGERLAQFNSTEIIIAGNSTPKRLEIAGSVADDGSDGWNDVEWQRAAKALETIAIRCKERFNLRTVFHHHTGTYVETPNEVARIMEMTDPALVGLCLDTGHYHYGGGDVVEATKNYSDRIWYLHIKDIWPDKLAQIRRERIHMRRAWAMDPFAELGQGCIDFPAFFDVLRSQGYQGWMIVEQDSVGRSQRDPNWSPVESARQSRDYLRDVLEV
ncbi:MAG: TIM barrel protein [Caldilineaceae bacterium SB0664_bin_27]|uniref:TIM barrel protein n=1 Tax=Caldilineaceae bacterium SB0664_bin_27 TaxID=2605260 RepID=A0A6B0Z1H0_9CHLR|nr:TIM barrel protein [Caldilineaceae bacterium SB0664_bin_27]